MEDGPQSVIIVFVRLPVPGQVKTRLAAGVGPDRACAFYEACAACAIRTCASLLGPGLQLVVQHSSSNSTEAVQAWVRGLLLAARPEGRQPAARAQSVSVIPQSAHPDLGEKMRSAMADQLAREGVRKVVLVGSDVPDLSKDVLQAALQALDAHQAVFGPAADGGYYLVGSRDHVVPELFQGITWSTCTVLQDTLAAARAVGADVAARDVLPTLRDIDTVQDLREWLDSAGVADEGGVTGRAELLERVRDILSACANTC